MPSRTQIAEQFDLDEEYGALQAVRAERTLRVFVEEAWRNVLFPAVPFVPNWHVDVICDHLEAVSRGDIKNLIINIPPRHLKSTTVGVCWPAWVWIKNPSFRWLFSSFKQSLAVRDSVDCRRIIESEWYREHWGHVYELTTDQNEKKTFENSKRGKRMAVGLHAGATGEGGDVVAVDDPHDINDQYSTTKIEAAINAWDQVMTQRVNGPESRKLVIAQRINERDLSGRLLKMGVYEHLCIPTEYDPKRSKVTSLGLRDPRKRKGDLLFPARFGKPQRDEAKKSLGPRGFSAQHQQDPSPEEGVIMKRGWWRYYQGDPEDVVRDMEEVIQSWDMAFKDEDTSSMVAGHVWGRKGANKYLLARICEHLDFVESVSGILALTQKWPKARAKLVEDKANGTGIIRVLRNKVPGLIPFTPEGSKTARAYACQPDLQAGNVWLPDPERYPWIKDLVECCASFPGGQYDDDVDAMTQALAYFRKHETDGFQGEIAVAIGVGRSAWKGAG